MNLPVYLDVFYFIKDDFNENTLKEIKHLKMGGPQCIMGNREIARNKPKCPKIKKISKRTVIFSLNKEFQEVFDSFINILYFSCMLCYCSYVLCYSFQAKIRIPKLH